LAVLAESPDGYTQTTMLSRGFPRAVLDRLVRSGFASSHVERRAARGDNVIEIKRVKITNAGRKVLARADHVLGGTASKKPMIPMKAPTAPRPGRKVDSHNDYSVADKPEDERRGLVADILRLSLPPQGHERGARLVLENNFTLDELRALAAALKEGITSVTKVGSRPKRNGKSTGPSPSCSDALFISQSRRAES
jgi:hypothetical protein